MRLAVRGVDEAALDLDLRDALDLVVLAAASPGAAQVCQ
jgi:hypothetical protein